MISNNRVVDDMPLFERMICNFCEIDDIQCLRIDDMHGRAVMIIKRSESVLAQGSECRLLLGALGEAEQGCNAPNTRVLSRKEYIQHKFIKYIAKRGRVC